MYNNYIFDLDGTLINSCDEVMKCFKKAFIKSNYPLDCAKLTHKIIGPPLYDIVSGLVPELKDNKKILEIVNNFSYYYDVEENDISYIYDGVYEVLNILKHAGKRLFMATFKPSKPTNRIISQFKLTYFDDVYTIDKFGYDITKEKMIELLLQKYNLNRRETLMLGDAPTDMRAAKFCSITSVAASWGYEANKNILKENADIVLNDIKDLLLI